MYAYQAIRCGDAEVVLAGGMENMSMIPYALPTARWGQRMADGQMVDLMVYDGLYEKFYEYHMGITAENIAAKYGITREEQDELGALSHQRAMKAINAVLNTAPQSAKTDTLNLGLGDFTFGDLHQAQRDGQQETLRGVDRIVLSMGVKSADPLSEQMQEEVAEVYAIGDAKETRSALEAIAEGAELGRRI